MKRTVTFTGVLEYDVADYSTDPEEVVDLALARGDKHADYYLFHTGEMTVVDDHSGTPGE
ncbi:hypothetical protein [Streptomyces sp. NPDC058272]|uniref:hypothetical protein n=1 Tax=Streptomyces sp. NPDC058272 TaxID=3346415 RepID=UPI0036E6E43D